MKHLARDDLLMKLGAAKKEAGKAWRLIDLQVPETDVPVIAQSFTFNLNRLKLRQVRKGEGAYLLRTNLVATAPEQLWKHYMVLTEIDRLSKNSNMISVSALSITNSTTALKPTFLFPSSPIVYRSRSSIRPMGKLLASRPGRFSKNSKLCR